MFFESFESYLPVSGHRGISEVYKLCSFQSQYIDQHQYPRLNMQMKHPFVVIWLNHTVHTFVIIHGLLRDVLCEHMSGHSLYPIFGRNPWLHNWLYT